MLLELKVLREKAGLTQREMALRLGYKYTSGYNQLETGKRRIDINTAKRISDILGEPMEKIFFTPSVVDMTTDGDNQHVVI